jgi:organic radical activating enzyme
LSLWQKGEEHSNASLLLDWRVQGYFNAFRTGAHLVVTGGEPLLQKDALIPFLEDLKGMVNVFVELETNGTIAPEGLSGLVDQYNVSPKLSNSGMPEEKRIVESVIKEYAFHLGASVSTKVCLKFVVANEKDVDEVLKLKERFSIRPQLITLMPEGMTSEELTAKAQFVWNTCVKNGFRYSDRLHVRVWGKKIGV